MTEKEKSEVLEQEPTSTDDGITSEQPNKSDSAANTKTSKDDGKNSEKIGDDKKLFTQDDMNDLAGKIRAEAKEAAQKALLKELGVDDPEAAKVALDEYKTLKEQSMTEREKLEARLAELETSNVTLKTEAEQRAQDALDAKVKAAIVAKAAGKVADAEVAYQLIDFKEIKVDEQGNVSGIETALENLIEKYDFLKARQPMSTTSAANVADAEKQARSDDERRREYFAMRGTGFFNGGGIRRFEEE